MFETDCNMYEVDWSVFIVFTDLLTPEKSSLEKSHVMLMRHTMGSFLKIK